MSGTIESYDLTAGSRTVAEFAVKIANVGDAADLGNGRSIGIAGSGAGWLDLSAALATYRSSVRNQVAEYGEVGAILDAMVAGVHQRLVENPVPATGTSGPNLDGPH